MPKGRGRAFACGALLALAAAVPVRGEPGERPEESRANPAIINAWVVDIPSPATITKVTGPVAILNNDENRYDLLEAGAAIGFDDIVRITEGASLEVTYRDGTVGSFGYGDFPAGAGGAGTWIVFKKSPAGGAE